MRSIAILLACSMLSAGGAAAQVATPSGDNEATLFGARESASHMHLSPGGNRVSYVAPLQGSSSAAFVADLTTGDVRPFLKAGRPGEKIQWCRFVTDSRLVCKYSVLTTVEGQLVPFTRLIAVDSSGANVRQLGQDQSYQDASLRQFDGDIIDWLPGQGGSVLMAKVFIPEAGTTGTRLGRDRDGLAVTRVDTITLKAQNLESPKRLVTDYLTDGRGSVRLMSTEEERDGILTGRIQYSYRPTGHKDWQSLTDMGPYGDFQPLAVDATVDSLYALKPLDGRMALYRVKLTRPPVTELVAAHPRVDIDSVVRSSNGERVIGYSLAEEKRETIFFDTAAKQLHEKLSRALPKLPMIDFLNASADGSRVLVYAGADNDPGRYFVYDHKTREMSEVLPARASLEGRTLASVKPVSIKVADGTMMPAYLTLPPGSSGKNMGAIVLPHGGPSSRDEWGFDWLAQYFAARGYAVLQPNYRGSAGFGDSWMVENGFKSWQVSIGDIAQAARWLVSEGVADPARLGIVGWSYGGYAALQAAATQPGLFKAVAAIAPVTDLNLLKTEAQGYTNSRLVARFIGSGPHIREGSPLLRASSIKAPVLLVHGDLDLNVGVGQSQRMHEALRQAGTPVQFLRYKGLDHQLEDSDARREFLGAIGKLMEQNIGR